MRMKHSPYFVFCAKALAATAFAVVFTWHSVRPARDAPLRGSLAKEVFQVVDMADAPNGFERCDTLLVGDSVARQLFPPGIHGASSNVVSLASNQAITAAGQHLLVAKFLANNPQTRRVVWLATPSSFANDMAAQYSFQYFIVPFGENDGLDCLDAATRRKLRRRFGWLPVENRTVRGAIYFNRTLLNAYLSRITAKTQRPGGMISDVSREFLLKTAALCRSRDIAFIVVPTPVCEDDRIRKSPNNYAAEIERLGLSEAMAGFCDRISYLPENCFRDPVHLSDDYLKAHREELTRRIMEKRARD